MSGDGRQDHLEFAWQGVLERVEEADAAGSAAGFLREMKTDVIYERLVFCLTFHVYRYILDE